MKTINFIEKPSLQKFFGDTEVKDVTICSEL
jgi:hypothetical protein